MLNGSVHCGGACSGVDDGRGGAEEVDENGRRIEPALMSVAEDGREDLLGLGPACVTVATADSAHRDGRSNRVLGSPISRVDDEIGEKR